MNAPHTLVGIGLSFATLFVVTACATAGRGPAGAAEEPPARTAAAQAGTAVPHRSNAFVLTAAEVATVPGITNAYDAVQALRPHFLRTRGSAARPGSMVGAGAEG